MFDARRGAWSTFQFLVRERLDEAGRRASGATARLVGTLGARYGGERGEARAGRTRPRAGARTAGSGSSST